MIPREIYLKKLRLLKDQDLIKVITGVRRSGKSMNIPDNVTPQIRSKLTPLKRI
jgi:predicted AAA+ superfamily ATPase